MDDQKKASKEKAATSRTASNTTTSSSDPPPNPEPDSPPAQTQTASTSTTTPPVSVNVAKTGSEERLRGRSTSSVVVNASKKKSSAKTRVLKITSTSSDGGPRMQGGGGGGGSLTDPPINQQIAPQLLLGTPPPVRRTYSGRGRHRQSGLFSEDDLSVDVSLAASDHNIPTLPPTMSPRMQKRQSSVTGKVASGMFLTQTGSGGVGKPISIGSASMGSASLGGGPSDIDDHQWRRRLRYKPLRRRWRRFQRKYKGCIFAMISSLTSSLASYCVHELTNKKDNPYDATYCLLWRYFGVLIPGIFIVMYYRCFKKEKVFDTVWPLKEKEPLKRFGLSIVRSVLDVLAVLLNYYAFSRGLLQSETSTILNSKPIVVQLLAHFTLGEPWGVVPILMSIVAAIGVLVISKPPFLEGKAVTNENPDRYAGVGFAIGSMLLASVVYVILRSLKDVHYSVFSLFIGTAGVIFGLGMTLGTGKLVAPLVDDLYFFLGLAALVCCSSIAIVIALQNEEAFVVSLVRSCDVIFSFIWEISLQGKYPDWYSGGGACIVMFCVVVIFFRKYLTHQDPESKLYKRFHLLTK